MKDRWIDEYLARRYEGRWSSTNFYFYERKASGRTPVGKYDAWNEMVSELSDLDRRDTQYSTARLLVGVRRVKWTYDTDEETGANEFVVGMCLLALHLTNQGFPAKVDDNGWGVHLMFDEDVCTGENRHAYCQGVVREVRGLHAKLLKEPNPPLIPDDVKLGIYR